MKSEISYPKHGTSKYLVACLAMLGALATPVLRSQTATTPPAAAPKAASSDDNVEVLSPFQVSTDKDKGYLVTNSATATRIGMEIQKIPLSVSVVGSEFMQDTGMRSLTDILGYTAGTAGDPRFVTTRPSNNATPQGVFTIRGFPVNIILRDGLLLYSTKFNVDNTDRVEIIKGPAAVFFGEGFPGGVINYVTKTASLGKLPSLLSYTFGADNTNRGLLDDNHVLSKTASIRLVAGWENSKGQREWEYTKRFDFTPSILLDPFANGKFTIHAQTVYLEESYNANLADWIYPSGWFQAYANPSQALINAAGAAVSGAANPVAAYQARIWANLGAYDADRRVVAGDPNLPLYTSISRGAYWTDTSGTRVHDEHFNYFNRGSFIGNSQTTSTFGFDANPFEWLSLRYNLTQDYSYFTDQEGNNAPNADGFTFNAASGFSATQYWRKTRTHQLDAVVKFDIFHVKNKLLFGYLLQNLRQQYYTPQNQGTPDYKLVPGVDYPTTTTNTDLTAGNQLNMVPTTAYITDRFGNIQTAQQVYSNWDPATQPQPPSSKLNPGWSNPIDGYPAQYNAWYVNYQGTALSDRLTLLGGFRQETWRQAGQALTANFPWFIPPPYAFANQTQYPPAAYDYSPAYAATNFLTQTGNSYMGGASYELSKGVNIYASVSQTFRFNSLTPLGGFLTTFAVTDPGFSGMVNSVLAANGGPFTYKYYNGGSTVITNVQDALNAMALQGANNAAANEVGKNIEIGSKLSLDGDKLVGTFSLFRADRNGQLLDDVQHQATEPFNYGNLPGIGAGTRNFRWRSTAHNRIEGFEAETIWSPIRNFQLLANASWYWTAKTLSDVSVAPSNIIYAMYFGNRIPNVPEYRANAFGKYTISDGWFKGLAIGFGGRYSSEGLLARASDWNPAEGALKNGNFVVFNGTVAYPWELAGYKITTQFVIDNIFSTKYIDGGTSAILAPTANWTLSNTLKF